MLQSEFEKLIGKRISVELYSQVIEPVYTFHPSINNKDGKSQICALWNIGGEILLRDMLGTAEKAKEIEINIRAYENLIKIEKAAIDKEADEYKKLKQTRYDNINLSNLRIAALCTDLKDMGRCPINLPGRDVK